MTEVLLTSFSDVERQQAMEHFAVIRPFLEDGVPLPTLAQQHGLALRTLRRWVARYHTHGLVGLLRKSSGDQGQRRRLAAEFEHIIEGLALRTPRPSIASVYRQAAKLVPQHGWPCPSYGTVYAVIRQLPPALVTRAHEGAQTYSDQFDLIHRREVSCSNDIWQADHTPLDIWLLDERGIPARPWLTVIIDDYSRAIASYFLSFQHLSALHTALALRQAIWRKSEDHWHICGIPTTFYGDHGSDFTSSPRQTMREVARLRTMRAACMPVLARAAPGRKGLADPTELVIVDEANRLKVTSLEQLRDFYDRRSVGLMLMGMPGIEKRMVRYPQLYSRVGFVHVIRPLEADELRAVLDRKWDQWGIGQASETVTTEAKAAIIRITQGNFRLLQWLFEQIGRILALNDLHAITPEVVEAARERLIIGKS